MSASTAKRTIEEILRKPIFATWLRQHGLGDLVGHTGRACGCPLANFLRGSGFGWVVVQPTFLRPDGVGTTTRLDLPDLARAFVLGVDLSGSGTAGRAVSAEHALFILEAIP